MNYTLTELLDKQVIVIPQIQRDYAQGRASRKQLRIGFLKKIKESLTDNQPALNLDFVYGYTEVIDQGITLFKPIDGQQRLTTLWLIHWYVAPKSLVEVTINNSKFYSQTLEQEAIELLKNFSYETRPSSKKFCKALVKQPLIKTKEKISDSIKDSAWFMSSWTNDPTIASMLNMLDDIEAFKTKDENTFTVDDWTILLSDRKLTFDYIDIKSEEFKLTDELYIKMNSRGKPLTTFENFKAQFSDLLSSKDTDYLKAKKKYDNIDVTYQEYFAFKIDNEWMDMFWSYRNNLDKFNDNKEEKDKVQIDDSLVNLIFFIAEIGYFKNKKESIEDDFSREIDSLKSIFKEKKNIDFLFDSLDVLSKIKDLDSFFGMIFSNKVFVENKVKLFDDNTTDLLFRSMTNNNFDVRHKILLYTILVYTIRSENIEVEKTLIDIVRVVRNLLLRVRQINYKKRIEYTTNLRFPNFEKHAEFIDVFVNDVLNEQDVDVYKTLSVGKYKGFDAEYINAEQEKATFITENKIIANCIHKLEDHNILQGNIDLFQLDAINFEKKAVAFRELWDSRTSTSLLIRALLIFGDFSVCTHESTSLGELWFFGEEDNWNRILTTYDKDEQEEIIPIFNSFLYAYTETISQTTEERLNEIIAKFEVEKTKDWIYYFISYPEFTSSGHYNLFSWGNSGFEVNNIGSPSGQPLSAFHFNPYIDTIYSRLNDEKNITWVNGRFSEPINFITLCDRFDISCKEEGWIISTDKRKPLTDLIIEKYKIKEIDKNRWLLKCKLSQDRITIGLDFCRDVISEFK